MLHALFRNRQTKSLNTFKKFQFLDYRIISTRMNSVSERLLKCLPARIFSWLRDHQPFPNMFSDSIFNINISSGFSAVAIRSKTTSCKAEEIFSNYFLFSEHHEENVIYQEHVINSIRGRGAIDQQLFNTVSSLKHDSAGIFCVINATIFISWTENDKKWNIDHGTVHTHNGGIE